MSYELLVKYTSTAAVSGLKFIFGPFTGWGLGLSIAETALCTATGMTLTVLIISLVGEKVHNYFIPANRKLFTPRNRLIIRIWRKYGIWGVAFLTPIFFTPIGGTLIAVSLGERYSRILPFMVASALGWGFALTFLVYKFGGQLDTILEIIYPK